MAGHRGSNDDTGTCLPSALRLASSCIGFLLKESCVKHLLIFFRFKLKFKLKSSFSLNNASKVWSCLSQAQLQSYAWSYVSWLGIESAPSEPQALRGAGVNVRKGKGWAGKSAGCSPQVSRQTVSILQAGDVAFCHLCSPTAKVRPGPKQASVGILWV